MLDIGYELKMRGARNIFTCCTFPLFTAGLEKFDKAYNDGIIKAVLGTNLTYRKPELLEREWYYDVDVSKYTAYFIAAINHDKSVSSIIDPMTKILFSHYRYSLLPSCVVNTTGARRAAMPHLLVL